MYNLLIPMVLSNDNTTNGALIYNIYSNYLPASLL